VIASGALVIVTSLTLMIWLQSSAALITLSKTGNSAVWGAANHSSTSARAGCHTEQRTEPLYDDRIIYIERIGCGADESKRTLFVTGDSHAEAYLAMLGRLSTETPLEVRVYPKYGCGLLKRDNPFRSKPSCHRYLEAVLGSIRRDARPGDILFLPALRVPPIENLSAETPPGDPEALNAARNLAIQDVTEALLPLDAMGIEIVFEAPKPVFYSSPFRCSDWFNRMNEACMPGLEVRASSLQSDRVIVLAQIDRIAQVLPHVRTWDPFPVLCPGEICMAVDRGVALFVDGNHLSGAGNDRLYASFSDLIAATRRSPGSNRPQSGDLSR
jgi:hypothetical protein